MIRRALRRTLLFCIALFLVASAWELYKLIGPEDGGSILGMEIIPKATTAPCPTRGT